MNQYNLFGVLNDVTFLPTSELEEILQNARTIIATRKGTVPNDRDFGISWDVIDRPINQATAMFSSEVIRQLAKYEPRAKVIRIELKESSGGLIDGKFQPVVTIGVNEL